MIHAMATEYTVCELCEAFDVSRSGYHARRRGGRSARAHATAELGPRVRRDSRSYRSLPMRRARPRSPVPRSITLAGSAMGASARSGPK